MSSDANPVDVWHLVERADELVKYARSRNPRDAWTQARAALEEAQALVKTLQDRAAAAALTAQINKRLGDLSALETGEP